MKKILFVLAVILSLGLASCGKWLDINVDPNSPSAEVVESDMIMPGVEMNLATSYSYLRRLLYSTLCASEWNKQLFGLFALYYVGHPQ